VVHVIPFAPLLVSKLYIIIFPNKLICISCILYVTFHVEWSLLGVRSLSKKGINSNNYFFYNNFLGLNVHYNAHNELYDIFSFFP
jgi:hypothetical protein